MKLRKDIIYEYIQKESYTHEGDEGFHTEELAEKLQMQRSNVSAGLNALVKEGKLIKTSTRPVAYKLAIVKNQNSNTSCFDQLIGHAGSLKAAIADAKAAILYPNGNLRLVLSSDPGCGTTLFSRLMYEYAEEKEVLPPNAPYVKLNCMHYGKNIAVLNDELFGLAGGEARSCFHRAQGGMLFIDNVQLLDARQQGRISEFIETSRIYSDDRTHYQEYTDIVLILSAPSGQIPEPFSRLGTIHLPVLAERGIGERFELINYFFANEAMESKTNISVTMDTVRALALASYPGNVKQLYNEIKAACAKAYVRTITDQSDEIDVVANDLEPQVRRSLLDAREHASELSSLTDNAESLFYDREKGYLSYPELRNTIYETIRKRAEELNSHGIGAENISGNAFVTEPVSAQDASLHENDDVHSIEQLSKVVDLQIINVVNVWFDSLSSKLDHKLNPNIFYGLCLHVNALIMHKSNLQHLSDEKMKDIVRNHPQEFNACVGLATVLNDLMHVYVSVDDIAVLAQFLIEDVDDQGLSHPVLLYIFHGSNTASSLRDVTNDLTHLNNAFAYDLNLSKDAHVAMEEIKRLIQRIDNGQGVIVIYDMGSIKTMLETIEQEINVRIRYMNMPVTLVGLNIARKCAMETDIDTIYHGAVASLKHYEDNERKNDVIVTLCQTGEGGAIELKHYIDQYSRLGIRTVAMAFSNREELVRGVSDLRKTYHIYAFVGTFDPKMFGIPFISISRVFNNPKEYLDQILNFEPVEARTKDYEQVYKLLEDQFHYVSIPKLKAVLPEVVDELGADYDLSDDQKDGVFMHLACSVERLMSGQPSNIVVPEQKQKVLSALKEDYAIVSKVMRRLERAFNIMFNDDEITTVIMILKRI